MNNGRKDAYEQRDSLKAWCLGLTEESLRNPLIGELNRLMVKIDNLLAVNDVAGNSNHNLGIPTANEMMVTFLLNRCEALQKQVTKGLNSTDQKRVDRILYPSLYIAKPAKRYPLDYESKETVEPQLQRLHCYSHRATDIFKISGRINKIIRKSIGSHSNRLNFDRSRFNPDR